jgi:vacuolar-type H+-ATPase subunit H
MAIDILHLVDRLEALVEQGRRLPLTSAVVIDEGTFLDIIDQMRISIPEEIKQAKRIEQERERIIAEAHAEAARIISQGREDAARLVADHELRRQAQEQAERMLEEARRQAQAIRQGADDYAAEVLAKLSDEVAGLQRVITNGLVALGQRRKAAPGGQPGGPEGPPA